MFILSVIFVIPNIGNWNVDISFNTIATITLGLFSFGAGEMIIRLLKTKYSNIRATKQISNKIFTPILINKYLLILSLPILVIVTYFYYQQVLEFAYAAGYSSGSSLPMLRFARIATISEIGSTVDTNKVIGQFVILTYAYSHVLLYVLLHNLILCNYKRGWFLYLFPIVIYFIQVVLTGGRTGFLYLISTSLMIGMIFYQIKTNWKSTNSKKYVRIGVIVLSVTVVVFFFLGNLTGKTSIFNFFETLSIYFGSSIVALDGFLESGFVENGSIFGGNTLFGIYDILRRLGFDIEPLNKAAEFTTIGSYRTNIYTSYMRYIKDFSHLGLILVQFFLGILFSSYYLRIKRENSPSLRILLYAILFQVILETAIEERFFMNILSIGYIIRFAYIFVLYSLLVKKRRYKLRLY
jgi:oligosaccharide repeat unit polymerase